MNIIEKYEKLRLQRIKAVRKWNDANRNKVNEYNRKYQARIYAEKKLNTTEQIKNNKEYQALYRKTKRLRQLPFFDSDTFN